MARKMSKTNKADPRKAVAYLRVSTDDQTLGPEAQRTSIEAWAAARGVSVVAWHTDHGVSGATAIDKRPGLLAAFRDLEAEGAGQLVVAKRDRLARDTLAAAMAERMADRIGATIASAAGEGEGTGPEAQLMRAMIDAFAQYERALIASRTRAALAVKSRRGERVGQVPYGSRLAADGVMLEADPDELRAVELIRELRAAGLTLRAIAARLEAEGLRPRGRRWYAKTVANILEAAA